MGIKKILLSCAVTLVVAATATTATADGCLARVYERHLSASVGFNVPIHSQSDIRAYAAAHPFDTTKETVYSKAPDMTAPYEDSGALAGSTLQEGVNALNTMRYIAGLPEVTLNGDYNAMCQDGAYVCKLNNEINHYPDKPEGISESIYSSGSAACGSSNLAMGYKNPAATVLGYMDDSDSSNIDRLGHRRWILNPPMKHTGFGYANDPEYGAWGGCSALYAFDNSFGDTDIKGVCWPAQTMPVEYFDGEQAWSCSLGYIIEDPDSVRVTLKRSSDGKTWSFSYGAADGFFNVENSRYGQPGCVIFRPNGLRINADDKFMVNIEGTGTPVNYTVNFFALSLESVLSPVMGLDYTVSANGVRFTWNKNLNAEQYVIKRYHYSGLWSESFTANTYMNVSGLEPNTTYTFRIYAVKGEQCSDYVEATVTTVAAAQSSTGAAPSSSSMTSSSSSRTSSSSSEAPSSSSRTSSSSSAALSSSSAASSSSSATSSSSSTASNPSNSSSSLSSTQMASGTSDGESSQTAAENNVDGSFPVVPFAIGGGVAVTGGIAVLVIYVVKKKNHG